MPELTLTGRELNRATLARQMLLRRQPLAIEDAVSRVLALQAQHPASPYLALWNRLTDFDPANLDAAFAERRVLKSKLIRMTLHAIHPDDHPAAWAAMQPSLRSRFGDRRFTSAGWSIAEADALVPELLAFAEQPHPATEIEAWLKERVGDAAKGLWWVYRYMVPLLHAPTGGPWSFGHRTSFVAADTGWPAPTKEAAAEGLRALARRYLSAFGPATAADLAQFAMVQRARAKEALEALANDLDRFEGPGGETLYDLPGAPRPPGDTSAPPRLMAMWDNTLLAYVDRSRIIPEAYRPWVTRVNGDVLPTLLVDGYVAGVWRAVEEGVEATAFHPLSDAAWDGLAAEARALLALLAEREPLVYKRYDHWWAKMPAGEVRLLPG